MGSNPYRKIQLLGITHPVVRITISGMKVHLGMERIRGPSGEEKARLGLIFVLCKFWVEKHSFVLYKDTKSCN